MDANQNEPIERRHMDSEFRIHITSEVDQLKERLITIETNLEEVLAILRGSKLIAASIKWLAGVAIAITAVWAALHGGGQPLK
jgi:hypothetical protein